MLPQTKGIMIADITPATGANTAVSCVKRVTRQGFQGTVEFFETMMKVGIKVLHEVKKVAIALHDIIEMINYKRVTHIDIDAEHLSLIHI